MVHAETKLILGAAILSLNGDEAIHGMLDIMFASRRSDLERSFCRWSD